MGHHHRHCRDHEEDPMMCPPGMMPAMECHQRHHHHCHEREEYCCMPMHCPGPMPMPYPEMSPRMPMM